MKPFEESALFGGHQVHLMRCAPMQFLDCDAEDMALNQEDWKNITRKIDAAIKQAVADFRPTGWAYALLKLRHIGTLATIVSLFVALSAITIGACYYSFSRVEKEAEFRTNTTRDLADLKSQMTSLRLLMTSSQPERRESQRAAREILAEIRRQSLRVPKDVAEQAGNNFLRISKDDPGAWEIALQLASYRTSLNSQDELVPKTSLNLRAPNQVQYEFGPEVKGKPPRA
ncbi:MAG: hypothetical protein ABSG65_24135 [Bryobacteraceae bacterium]|jgi:hypothetical protein